MNTKKICLGLALMMPMVFIPEAMAQGCGGPNGWQGRGGSNGWQGRGGPNGWQGRGYGNGFRNGPGNWQNANHMQQKMQRKMARRAWKQRQLALSDPYYNYWRQHPSEYQNLWRSQAEMDDLLSQGLISNQERALLQAQMDAYQRQMNLSRPGGNFNGNALNNPFFTQDPYGLASFQGGFPGGFGGNPYINNAIPGILQRLAGYWAGQPGLQF